MELLLIRHAIAVDREEGLPDEQRPLTPKGRKRFQQEVDGLRRLELRIDRLYTSPLVRDGEEDQEPELRRGEEGETVRRIKSPNSVVVRRVSGEVLSGEGVLWVLRPWRGAVGEAWGGGRRTRHRGGGAAVRR